MISRIFESLKNKTSQTANDTVELLFKGVLVVLLLATAVWISLFLYVAFYYSYVPSVIHTRPIFLQYDNCKESKTCYYPSSNVQLAKGQSLLMAGQSYKITVSLEMPESPANKETGMFMVCAQFLSKSTTVANSCRPTVLRYSSPLVRTMRILVFAPMYIWGSFEEKQTVNIELHPSFEEDSEYGLTDIVIEVRSTKAEIYQAELQISAQMRGLRYLMFHFPFLSGIIGVSFNLLCILFLTLLSAWQLYGPSTNRDVFYQKLVHTLKLKQSDNHGEPDISDLGGTDSDDAKELAELEKDEQDKDFIQVLQELGEFKESQEIQELGESTDA